ncbi:MAG TPA: hypothetical protein VHO66_04765 [Ruminiclostridium sp.]|nr:hypothetical protein [Ruminiclostridium sp.]
MKIFSGGSVGGYTSVYSILENAKRRLQNGTCLEELTRGMKCDVEEVTDPNVINNIKLDYSKVIDLGPSKDVPMWKMYQEKLTGDLDFACRFLGSSTSAGDLGLDRSFDSEDDFINAISGAMMDIKA